MRTISAGLGMPALAQQAQDVIGKLGDQEGIFVDGKTFDIARGAAKGDPPAAIAKHGAKEVGPGAIISARATSSSWWRADPTRHRKR
jgi:hypothetical protein